MSFTIPWRDLLTSPALWLAGAAAVARWLIAPAVVTYMRRDLQRELGQLGAQREQLPRLVDRVARLEQQAQHLEELGVRLERMEAELELLCQPLGADGRRWRRRIGVGGGRAD